MTEDANVDRFGERRFFVVFVALAAAVAIAGAFGSVATVRLSYQRAAVESGEIWRLVTSPLVHADLVHLAWNLAALAIVAVAVGPSLSARGWCIATLASALGAGIGVHVLSPRILAMLGLSGVLHGQLAAGAWRAARAGERAGWVLLALLLLKLGLERVAPMPWSAAALGERIAVDSHLYGALAGFAAGLFLERRQAA